jgi:hypothetical protein
VGEVAGQSQSPSTKCADNTAHADNYGPFDTVCDSTNGPHVGKYVTVVLPKASGQWGWPNGRQLNLAEVEVFAGPGPDLHGLPDAIPGWRRAAGNNVHCIGSANDVI